LDSGYDTIAPSHQTSDTTDSITAHDTTNTNNDDLVYTFIIHKSGCPNLPPATRKSPNFAAFDHGDHYHFIYTSKHNNNATRALNTILQFLNTGFEGTTEANTALQLVHFYRRFISYLIRKGIRTFHKYGHKTITILTELTKCLLQYDVPEKMEETFSANDATDGPSAHIYNIRDNKIDTTLHHCDQYTEDKKTSNKEAITQRTFSIDYISNLITTHKITSYESFQRTLSTNVKIQLLKQLDYVGQNIIKTLIKIHTTETLQSIKQQHYYTIILNNFNIQHVVPSNVHWLTSLFEINNIDIPSFFAHFLLVHSTNITKIKSFILKGPTNTGKSR
jgi:hypothetical protein